MPTHAEFADALRRCPTFESLGHPLIEVEAHEADALLVLDLPRLGGRLGVEVPWPDEPLRGMSTGEPVEDVSAWAVEVALWLAEEAGTADPRYVLRHVDPAGGMTVIEFPTVLGGDFVRELVRLAGLEQAVDLPGRESADHGPADGGPGGVGLARQSRDWRVFSPDAPDASYEVEEYAWGDLFDRVNRIWPDRIEDALDLLEG